MNKDNRKLTKLYQLIQEAFEPGSYEDIIDGPARELLEELKSELDSAFNQFISENPEHQTKATQLWSDIRANLIKSFTTTVRNTKDKHSDGKFGYSEYKHGDRHKADPRSVRSSFSLTKGYFDFHIRQNMEWIISSARSPMKRKLISFIYRHISRKLNSMDNEDLADYLIDNYSI